MYNNLFYFDIETVSNYSDLDALKTNEREYDLFVKKYNSNSFLKDKLTIEEAYRDFGSIFSNYGKIVCISYGYFTKNGKKTISSFYGDNEFNVVNEFNDLLIKVNEKMFKLSGYRVLAFDIPYIPHKLNKYDIEPSKIIDVYGCKPWDVKVFDLADEWKQKFNHVFTFDEVCYELGIDSPKEDISGKDVGKVYWIDKDLERIKTYCEKDVLGCMRVGEKMLKYRL